MIINVPGPKILLAIVFKPYDARLPRLVPVVEHTDQHDIAVTIAIKVLVLESDPESRWIAEMISADVKTKNEEAEQPEEVSDPST